MQSVNELDTDFVGAYLEWTSLEGCVGWKGSTWLNMAQLLRDNCGGKIEILGFGMEVNSIISGLSCLGFLIFPHSAGSIWKYMVTL